MLVDWSNTAKEPRKKKKKLNAPQGVGITGEHLQASVSEAVTKKPIPNDEEKINLLVEEDEELEQKEELKSLPADDIDSEISVSDYFSVEYGEEFFYRRVESSFNGEVEVNVMVPPESVNNRGYFRVPEIESYWKC